MRSACRLITSGLFSVLSVLAGPLAAQSAPPLVLAIGGEPETGFDPVMGWGRYGNPLFHAPLLKMGQGLLPEGDAARAWTLSEDRLVWTFTLRPDVTFADGRKMTAGDVVFTFNAARDASGLADLKNLKEARQIAPDQVELQLHQPQITFVNTIIALGIVPEGSTPETRARQPLGAGPFRFVEWREGEQLIIEPNPHWHGGKTAFPRVTFVFGDEAAAVALARAGQAHVSAVPALEADAPPVQMRVEHVVTVDNRGISFPMDQPQPATAQGKPLGHAVTSDKAIRLAVNQALDRSALVRLALNGHGDAAFGPADGLPWDNPEAADIIYGKEAAIATLEAAGWRIGADGIREKEGQRASFALLYPASDSLRQVLALGVAQQMGEIGLELRPKGQSWDEIYRDMHGEAVIFGWGALDPLEVFNLYHGRSFGDGAFNPGRLNNPTVNRHLEDAEGAASLQASLPHWQAALWDGETGAGPRGEAAWAWLVNIRHSYWVDACLETGPLGPEPHGHGYPVTATLPEWRWVCP